MFQKSASGKRSRSVSLISSFVFILSACTGEIGSPEPGGHEVDVRAANQQPRAPGSAASSGAAGAPTPAPASAGGMEISAALKLDKASVVSGDTVSATVTYTNTSRSPVTIWTLTIAGRRPGATHVEGPFDDFTPNRDLTTLAPGDTLTLAASREFVAGDATGTWEAYPTYQDDKGLWHDGPGQFFSVSSASNPSPAPDPAPAPTQAPAPAPVASAPAPTPAPAPSSGAMSIGTNFWYHGDWSGEKSMKSGIDWATAYGSGANGLAATDVWNEAWVKELAPYSTLRFMDWGNTNWSKITTWSQRRLPTDPGNYETYIDASSPVNNPGVAYEWMVDLGNRLQKDIWICVPAQADANYWTELAKLLKAKLQPGRKLYIEYSNETWNGMFGQFQYTIDKGVAQGLPGSNQWYQGQAYAVLQSVRIFEAFEDVFGADAMGTQVIRVFAYGGNMDTGRSALKSIYKSATYNPRNVKIDMLAIAPYVGSGLDGAASDIATQFRRGLERQFVTTGEVGTVAFALQDSKSFGIPSVGAYEGGQHLLKNAKKWSMNPKIYDEYMYMLDRYGEHLKLFMHYAHTGTWTDAEHQGSWGAKDHTGQSVDEAHKYRALSDWVRENP